MAYNIRAVIIDDEPLARQGLALRISEHPDFDIVAQCADGQEALELLNKIQADVLFVDIEMPRINGLELAAILYESISGVSKEQVSQAFSEEKKAKPEYTLPKIVFVTAFKDFALNAFEYQAFDYLLKPLSDDRVNTCLNNLKHAFQQDNSRNLHNKLVDLINRNTGESTASFVNRLEQSRYQGIAALQETISLKSGNEWIRVPTEKLLWIEAAGDYMCVHTQNGTHIIRKTLKQFEEELNTELFTRINRSTIVNVSKITKLTPNSNGEYIATLTSGDEVKVTRNYRANFAELN